MSPARIIGLILAMPFYLVGIALMATGMTVIFIAQAFYVPEEEPSPYRGPRDGAG